MTDPTPPQPQECPTCFGYGHINDKTGRPSIDRRDRKCGDCRGEGVIPGPPFVLPDAEPQAMQPNPFTQNADDCTKAAFGKAAEKAAPSPSPPVDIDELQRLYDASTHAAYVQIRQNDADFIVAAHDALPALLAEVRDQRNASMERMSCEECGGWFKIGNLQSASVDPESAPVCDRCLELATLKASLHRACTEIVRLGGKEAEWAEKELRKE